jgi:hypothetical protein
MFATGATRACHSPITKRISRRFSHNAIGARTKTPACFFAIVLFIYVVGILHHYVSDAQKFFT